MTQLLFPEAVIGGNLLASSRRIISRDEMNLAEFPLTVLSTRVDPTIKTLEFTDSVFSKNGDSIERKWIITGADKFGLPTASDDEVLLGLMKLTVDSGFKDRKVFFSRYELLKILRWTTEGRSYTRLQRALDRLSGVRIKATNAFYDNESKSHSTRNFGIIDAYEINDGRTIEAKPSFFSWSDVMFKSFQVGFIKKLDLQFYLGLESAVSKRLYRFLDKHFWYKSRLTMNLFVLAHEKIGISRNYQYASSLRQQLDPAFDELIKEGFISSYDYQGKGRGTEITVQSASSSAVSSSRTVSSTGSSNGASSKASGSQREERGARFQKPEVLPMESSELAAMGTHAILGAPLRSESPRRNTLRNLGEGAPGASSANMRPQSSRDEAAVPTNVPAEFDALESSAREALITRGITPQQSTRLVRGRSATSLQRILDIVAYFDRLCSNKSKLVSRSPIGFLYRAVENPEAFILPSEKNAQGAFPFRGPSHGPSHGESPRGDPARAPYVSPENRTSQGMFSAASSAKNSMGRDRLAELQASYLEARRRAVQQMKLDVEPSLLLKITKEVEDALAKLRALISPRRFEETVEHGIEERLVKLFLFPDFDEWIQQQKLGAA
jgi:hypothetical protein